MAGSSQPSSGMILVDGAESMLLTFASGALTGVACLAVLRKRLRRDKEVSLCSRVQRHNVAEGLGTDSNISFAG
jgi:hypothetical protein